MKIWTHPWAVKLEAIKRMEREKFDEMEEFLDDSESEAESSLHDKGDSKEKNVSKDTWKSSDSEEGKFQFNRMCPKKVGSCLCGHTQEVQRIVVFFISI